MADVIVRFEREDREGLVAVGSYLIDAVKRLGIRLPDKCSHGDGIHHCLVTIRSGSSLLSPVSQPEKEHLASLGRKESVRLACYAKINDAGEITVMTEQTKEETKNTETRSKLVDEFEALPLEKKIADLVRMEAVALGETVSFVVNSPYLVLEKIGDVLAEFGMKLDREAKESARPAKDAAKPAEKAPAAAAPKPRKKPAAQRARKPAKE